MIVSQWRLLAVSALLGVMLGGCETTQSGGTLVQQGFAAGRVGDYQRMLTLCQEAASAQAADPQAFRCLAEAQARLGYRNEAESSYLTYLDRVPGDADARLALAKLLMDNGRYTQAQVQLEKVLTQNPSNVEVLTMLGDVFRLQNLCKPALEYYDRALSLSRNHGPALEGKGKAQQGGCRSATTTHEPPVRDGGSTLRGGGAALKPGEW